MRRDPVYGFLALSLALTGCGTLFSARATVTPNGAQASVQTDSRVAAAAGLAAGLAGAAINGASASGETATRAPTVASGGEASVSTTSSTTTSASSGVASVSTPTPRSVAAQMPRGRATGVTVERIGAGGSDVVAGGLIALEGAPLGRGLRVVDGRVEVRGRADLPSQGGALEGTARARWELASGVLLLADADGHRWRVRVGAGSLSLRSEGANSVGRTVWTPSEGSLAVSVIVAGDRELALDGDVTSGVSVASAAPMVPLAPGSLAALDALMGAAPAGSEESMRLASAVEVVTRSNTSGDPAFFTVPVRGRSIVLVIDVSYSMRDDDPRASDLWVTPHARPTKLDVARAELVKLLGALPGDVRVDVVAFSSSVRSLWPTPRALDAASLAEAIRWVAALRPGDETEPVAALEAAAALQPEQIVLLSDGRPTDREGDGRALLGLAQGISARIRLDVVGIGPDQDRPFLAALAESGRGELRMR